MKGKHTNIARTCPQDLAEPRSVFRFGQYEFFLHNHPQAGMPNAEKTLAPEAVEEIARFSGWSIEETTRFLNISPEPAQRNQRAETEQVTRSDLDKPVRWFLPYRGRKIPEAADALDPGKVEDIVGFFQAALGSIGGRIGGRSRSEAKVAAARENGKKGGRPKGSKNKFRREGDEKQRDEMKGRIEVRRVE